MTLLTAGDADASRAGHTIRLTGGRRCATVGGAAPVPHDLSMRNWAVRELAALSRGFARTTPLASSHGWWTGCGPTSGRPSVNGSAHRNIGQREKRLTEFGPAVAAVLAVAGDDSALAVGHELAALSPSSLLAHGRPPRARRRFSPALAAVADSARGHLAELLAQPRRADDDWSIAWTSPGGADPDRLAEFLHAYTSASSEVAHRPSTPSDDPPRIDDAGLPVTHITRRVGRPSPWS